MNHFPTLHTLCLITLFASSIVSASTFAESEPIAASETISQNGPENCVYARDVKQFEILDNETLLLRGKFDRYWVSRLDSQCAGLRRNLIIKLDRFGSQICANDRFTAQRRGASLGGGTAAICRLGHFEEIAVEQASVLKQAVSKS